MCNHVAKTTTYQEKYEIKGNKQLIVRVPEVSDAQGLINYMKDVDCETRFLSREPDEFDFTLKQEEEFIKSLADDKNSQLLIAEVNGQMVANCSVGIVMNNRRYLHRAALGISVRQAFWGMGIGQIMMQECINWCMDNGIEQLELEVVTRNDRALIMYKSLGFEIHGTKKHALKYSDGIYADEYFMILFLDVK